MSEEPRCDWAGDPEHPCWGKLEYYVDALPDGEGSDYPVDGWFCEGHKNFATFEGEGYTPEPT